MKDVMVADWSPAASFTPAAPHRIGSYVGLLSHDNSDTFFAETDIGFRRKS